MILFLFLDAVWSQHSRYRVVLVVVGTEEHLQALREGSLDALAYFYREHRPALYGFSLRMLGQAALAEDLVQETFIRLVDHRHRLRPDTNVRAWLFTVCRNLVRSYVRSSLVSARGLQELAQTLSGATHYTPEEAVTNADNQRELHQALSRLSHSDRELLLLTGQEDLDAGDIAKIIGVAEATYRKRLSRARQRLQAQFQTTLPHLEVRPCQG